MLKRPAFIGTVLQERPIGFNPPRREKRAVQSSSKGSGVTGKHKKWLAELQSAKKEEMKAEQEKLARYERVKKALAEKSAQMRDLAKKLEEAELDDETRAQLLAQHFDGSLKSSSKASKSEDGETVYALSSATDITAAKSQQSSEDTVSTSTSASTSSTSGTYVAATPRKWVKRKRADKPMWAMTIEESEEAVDEEADDLVKFADGLDYDEIVEDLEVREALRFVNQRVTKIKADQEAEARRARAQAAGEIGQDDDEFEWVEVDENGLTAKEAAYLRKHPSLKASLASSSTGGGVLHEQGWNSSTKTSSADTRAKTPVTDTATVSTLKQTQLANIHSDASLRTLVGTQAASAVSADLAATRKSAAAASTSSSETEARSGTVLGAVPTPKIVVVSPKDAGPDNTSKPLGSTLRASGLPYLYRNPSV